MLEGRVLRSVPDTLVLLKPYEDVRYRGIKIPVQKDSTFQYELPEAGIEKYNLVFLSEYRSGGWRPVSFFTDGDTISFTLYDMYRFDENEIVGSDLLEEKRQFEAARKAAFMPKFVALSKEMEANPDDQELGAKLRKQMTDLNAETVFWQQEYLAKSPSVLGLSEYFDLLDNLENFPITRGDLSDMHTFWVDRFPENSLNQVIKDLYGGNMALPQLGAVHDFDLIGKDGTQPLSSFITQNEYTLLDLWAPWCGPCLKKSKAIQAAYDNLLNNGLVVVGVIGGINNQQAFEMARQKHNYPWATFPEINDAQKIWLKYGVNRSGGGQFLINKEGVIVAFNPSVETIESFLAE